MAIKLKKIKFPFKRKDKILSKPVLEKTEKQHSNEITNNPYLQSRALWNDIYGSAVERYKKARKLNFILAGLVGVAILGVTYIGAQSKLIPYVVQVQNGQVIYTGIADQSNYNGLKPRLASFFIQQFVQSARSVSVDGNIEKSMETKAFAFTKGAATTELDDFYKKNDPYNIVKDHTISVKFNYVNSLPNNAFEVGWTEIARDSQTGQAMGNKKFIGEFDFKWDKPSKNEFILRNNPFGFYVTNISWTGVK